MAKLISPVWSTIRGSIAGTTYFNSPSGAIIARARVRPVNTMTNLQQFVRSALATAVQHWGTMLTEAQRHSWSVYASTVTYTGPYGVYHPTGRQMYIATYVYHGFINFLNSGSLPAWSFEAPSTPGPLVVQNINVSTPPPTGTGFIIGGLNRNGENIVLAGARSFGYPASRNYHPTVFLSELTEKVSTITNNSSGQVAWTDCIEGLAYWGKVRCISAQAPYRLSQVYIMRAVADTGGD